MQRWKHGARRRCKQRIAPTPWTSPASQHAYARLPPRAFVDKVGLSAALPRDLQFYISRYITCYMKPDVIRELGYLALGTRLKRLGERLQAQTQVLLEEAGVELPASHFPILVALDRLGPLSVGEIAEAVGMSQPGVTRMLDKLQSDGLVKSTAASSDRRVRTIGLTAAGEKLVASSKRRVWPRVESAVADACRGRAESLLPALAALEESLLETPLNMRAAEKTRARA